MAADPRALIAERIKASRKIAITSHLRPDGDSLCTARALALMAGELGLEAAIVNTDPTPLPFSGFPDLAAEVLGRAQGRYDADGNRSPYYGVQDPYEIVFDADAEAALYWWQVFRDTRPKDEPG